MSLGTASVDPSTFMPGQLVKLDHRLSTCHLQHDRHNENVDLIRPVFEREPLFVVALNAAKPSERRSRHDVFVMAYNQMGWIYDDLLTHVDDR